MAEKENKMKDLMLDIETLGVRPTSVIVQIGACYFDRATGEIGDTFCENIDVESAINTGLTLDWSTIKWWFEQKNRSWLVEPRTLFEVMGSFLLFIKKADFIWSHSTFDIPILTNAFRATGWSKLPFHYRATRDIRTLTHLAGYKRNEPETFKGEKRKDDKTHNALEDCFFQVKYCVECLKALTSPTKETK